MNIIQTVYRHKRTGELINSRDLQIIQLTSDMTVEEVKDLMMWGTYGINGDQPLKWIPMKDLTLEHLEAILIHEPTMGQIEPLANRVIEWWRDYRKGVQS